MDINTDPRCSKTMDPDMAILGPDDTIALGQHGFISSAWSQQQLYAMTISLTSVQHPVATRARDLNTDSSCVKFLNPAITPSHISGPDISMASGDSKAHPICLTGGSMTLKY